MVVCIVGSAGGTDVFLPSTRIIIIIIFSLPLFVVKNIGLEFQRFALRLSAFFLFS